MRGWILDCYPDYEHDCIVVWLKTEHGVETLVDRHFRPSFYVKASSDKMSKVEEGLRMLDVDDVVTEMRTTLTIAFSSLGGTVIDLTAERDMWNLELREGAVMAGTAEEHVKDAARVLSEYADAIAIRSLARHDDWAMERRDLVLVSFQKHSSVPIFNMESVLEHPCQAWGDALTL